MEPNPNYQNYPEKKTENSTITDSAAKAFTGHPNIYPILMEVAFIHTCTPAAACIPN